MHKPTTINNQTLLRKRFAILSAVAIIIISVVAILLAHSPGASAAPDDPTDESCFVFNSTTGTITDYTPGGICNSDVVIPDTIGGVVVINVGDYAFSNNSLASVAIPDSVTAIGDYAFSHNNLTSVTIPDSVTTIGDWAFSNNNLTSLHLGDEVTNIGESAFYNNNLTSVTIPDSVTTIGYSTFRNNSLTSVTIPDSVTTIGDWAFGENNLTSVTINGNPYIGTEAFALNGVDWSTLPESIHPWSSEWFDWYADNAELVHIYATDPAFIAANQDTLYIDTWDSSVLGGYLINPAPLTINYLSSIGTDLATSRTLIGSNPALQSYGLADFIDMTNPDNPVLDEDALATLYRIGDEVEVVPPAIEGFTTPEPFTLTLALGETEYDVTYASLDAGGESDDSDSSDASDGSASTDQDRLADTGSNAWVIIASSLLLIGGAGTMLVRTIKR